MKLEITHVDAFTDERFTGNPAGVCVLERGRDDSWMQNVAKEMNLSETAFLRKKGDGFDLRWFTPTVEVDLCGHATLASAHVLWEEGRLGARQAARFHTKSGLLTARRAEDDWIELDFPALPPKPATAPAKLEKAIGAKARSSAKSAFDFLLELDSEKTVRSLSPDFGLLASLPMRGVIVTAPSSSRKYHFVSRFFAPRVGINEDPVTGSAHCVLGPYWGMKLGLKELVGYQASARGGVVRVGLAGDRVHLGGKAVTVMRSTLLGEAR
jgi:PhzF family phenazine biosynthesis protein